MGWQAIILAGLILAGCTHTQPVEDPRSVWCAFSEPRRPSIEVIDAMTRAELDALNTHNSKGAAWCGWEP